MKISLGVVSVICLISLGTGCGDGGPLGGGGDDVSQNVSICFETPEGEKLATDADGKTIACPSGDTSTDTNTDANQDNDQNTTNTNG